MKTQFKKQIQSKKNLNQDSFISKTGYRALFLLLKLLESPKTRSEILECFKQDSVINSELTKDTVTNTINTLRKAGCVISRPNQRTNNKYVLTYHPFLPTLNEEQVNAINSIRQSVVDSGDWELLVSLNNFCFKLANLIPDISLKNNLLFSHPMRNINMKLFHELSNCCKEKKEINIKYFSSKNGEEYFSFIPELITLEFGNLYVWGYSKKYKEYSYIRVDKIRAIGFSNFPYTRNNINDYEIERFDVEFVLQGLSALLYEENSEDIVVENIDNNKIKIKTSVNNKFSFYQKILSYGKDCEIISPDFARREILSIVQDMKKRYENASK